MRLILIPKILFQILILSALLVACTSSLTTTITAPPAANYIAETENISNTTTVPSSALSVSRTPIPTIIPSPTQTQIPSSAPTPTLSPLGEIQQIPDGFVYLGDQEKMALGFNMSAGGSIGSLLFNGFELIDHTDYGRYIQLSFYDGSDLYKPLGNDPYGDWGWNPIQAGSKAGGSSLVGAKVLEYRAADQAIYIKSLGKEWGKIDQDSDVVFETWAWLRDGYFEVSSRATHTGSDSHSLASQEFPAAYFATSLTHEFGYFGVQPFTGAPIDELHQVARVGEIAGQGSCQMVFPTENWVAFGNADRFGLILALPPQKYLQLKWNLCLLYDIPPVGYISPSAYFDVPSQAVREITYYLIPGQIETARAVLYDLIPHTNWTFNLNSTEGWSTKSTPVEITSGIAKVYLSPEEWFTSPPGLRIFGHITPSVKLQVRTQDTQPDICLQFLTTSDPFWDSAKVECATVASGDFQMVTFDFHGNPAWNQGLITQLRLTSASPKWLEIDSVTINTQGYTWEFEEPGNDQGWVAWNQLSSPTIMAGVLDILSIGNDPYLGSPADLSVEAASLPFIEIRMSVSAGTQAQLFFITSTDNIYDELKSLIFPIFPDGQFHTYTLDMSAVRQWQDTITQIRLDPTNTSASIEIDYIQITGRPLNN